MLIQIAICFPVAFFFLFILYGTGLVINKIFGLNKNHENGSHANFVGHCLLGFITYAMLYASMATHGKTILIGILPLVFIIYRLSDKGNNDLNFKQEALRVFQNGIFGRITLLLIISFLFLLFQQYASLSGDYPLVFYDYQLYAITSKGIGIAGLENALAIYKDYGWAGGTLLYHYTDMWVADLLARLTQLNHLMIILFVIYPIILTLLISGMIGTLQLLRINVKQWQVILLLLISAVGVNLYLPFYAHLELLNNFGLKCFPGLYQAHKLSIIFVLLFCSLFQFLSKDTVRAVLWLCLLCLIYPTVIPAVLGGAFITITALFFAKKLDLKTLLKLVTPFVITLIFVVAFDHLFSDKPRQAVKLDFLHQIKLIIVLDVSYLLKLAIVFFPTILLLLTRFIYRIKFGNWEKTFWLFIVSATFSATSFAAENHGTTDISQAIYNIAPPLIIIISLVSLAIIIKSTIPVLVKAGIFAMLCAFAGFNLFNDARITTEYLKAQNAYSKKYIVDCLEDVNKNNASDRFVNIVLVDSNDLQSWSYDFHQKGSFLYYSDKVIANLDISPFVQPERNYAQYFSSQFEYNNPIEKWLKKNDSQNFIVDSSLLLKYFREFHIDYIDVSSGYGFSDEVKKHLRLVSKDQNTGELFYRIVL